MAKPGLSQVATNQTFQTWLDRTNEVVTILSSDAITASSTGDSTTGNATLVGTFTANTVIGFNDLRSNSISPRTGSSISISAATTTTSSNQTVQTLISSNGPRKQYSTGSTTWTEGFLDSSGSNFIIDAGSGTPKFSLSSSGTLTLSTGTSTGTLVANVTGTVSSLSNHTTSNLAEGTNLYFTTARARSSISADGALTYNASTGVMSITDAGIRSKFSGGTGVTYNSSTGVISIGQGVATTSNVTFNNITSNGKIQTNNIDVSGSVLNILDGSTTFGEIVNSSGSLMIRSGTTNILLEDNVVVAGNITASGNVTAFSDERLKKNIRTIDDAVSKVTKMRGVYFDKDEKPGIGVIAQEVEKIIPEVVQDGEFKSVAYGNIVGLLIEAIKELKSEIEDLKKR